MHRFWTLFTLFLTIFIDFFNLGMIYPIFNALVFQEGVGLSALQNLIKHDHL